MPTDNELRDFKVLALKAKVLGKPDDSQAEVNAKFFVDAISIIPGLVDEVLGYRDLQRRRLGMD